MPGLILALALQVGAATSEAADSPAQATAATAPTLPASGDAVATDLFAPICQQRDLPAMAPAIAGRSRC